MANAEYLDNIELKTYDNNDIDIEIKYHNEYDNVIEELEEEEKYITIDYHDNHDNIGIQDHQIPSNTSTTNHSIVDIMEADISNKKHSKRHSLQKIHSIDSYLKKTLKWNAEKPPKRHTFTSNQIFNIYEHKTSKKRGSIIDVLFKNVNKQNYPKEIKTKRKSLLQNETKEVHLTTDFMEPRDDDYMC
eukprot:270010_1